MDEGAVLKDILDYESETNFIICVCCLRKMCKRDIQYHFCPAYHLPDGLSMKRLASKCHKNVYTTCLFSTWFLKDRLGKDLTKKIILLVLQTKRDLPLWYIQPKIKTKRKQKQKQNRKGIIKYNVSLEGSTI